MQEEEEEEPPCSFLPGFLSPLPLFSLPMNPDVERGRGGGGGGGGEREGGVEIIDHFTTMTTRYGRERENMDGKRGGGKGRRKKLFFSHAAAATTITPTRLQKGQKEKKNF